MSFSSKSSGLDSDFPTHPFSIKLLKDSGFSEQIYHLILIKYLDPKVSCKDILVVQHKKIKK